MEGATDRKLLSGAFESAGIRNPLTDEEVLAAKLPDGKSSISAIDMTRLMLKSLVGREIKIVVLCDADYTITEEDARSSRDKDNFLLGRKEIENYYIEANVFARAADLAHKRRTNVRQCLQLPPTPEQVQSKLDALLENCQDTVRYQLVPRHREALGKRHDPSHVEAEADQWFRSQWSKFEWKIKTVPGKHVLKQLRQWCQLEFGLTVTEQLLARAMEPPEDLRSVLQMVSDAIFS